MNIGQASKASGVSAEDDPLLRVRGSHSAADRKASGYRDDAPEDIHRLGFIRRARDLGFSSSRSGTFFVLERPPAQQCGGRSASPPARGGAQGAGEAPERVCGYREASGGRLPGTGVPNARSSRGSRTGSDRGSLVHRTARSASTTPPRAPVDLERQDVVSGTTAVLQREEVC